MMRQKTQLGFWLGSTDVRRVRGRREGGRNGFAKCKHHARNRNGRTDAGLPHNVRGVKLRLFPVPLPFSMLMPSSNHSRAAAPGSGKATIMPAFPLILLETMRDMDQPQEVFEEENVAASMPRRLGLSDVVLAQIRRLEEEIRKGRPQSSELVTDLIRLVIKRPDAEEILVEAGRRIAWQDWEQRSAFFRKSVRLLPRPLAHAAARRAARRLVKRLKGGGRLSVRGRPLQLSLNHCLTANADPGGVACSVFSGLLTELLHEYTRHPYRVGHVQCEARGAGRCRWVAKDAGTAGGS